uniref:Uncharacterized protein n=1 Tax=Bos mutus grunniens TaxID=30521 RepID=A0A8C0A8A2_BOSMU
RKWQPTPVFLPGESQGRRGLVGCRLWGLFVFLIFSSLQLFLPSTGKKSAPANGNSPEGDLPRLVDDMFIFQNMEFTKVVGNSFLVCVDCEIGPIGCHCLDDKNSFYVSLEWVSHD